MYFYYIKTNIFFRKFTGYFSHIVSNDMRKFYIRDSVKNVITNSKILNNSRKNNRNSAPKWRTSSPRSLSAKHRRAHQKHDVSSSTWVRRCRSEPRQKGRHGWARRVSCDHSLQQTVSLRCFSWGFLFCFKTIGDFDFTMIFIFHTVLKFLCKFICKGVRGCGKNR